MGALSRAPFEVARLQAERLETTEKIKHLQAEVYNLAEPSADEADFDAYEREKIWALIQTLQHKLESIDNAIRLAQTGGYGICQSCGTEIDPARLEILPQATLCLKCQREFERRNRRARP
jgi:RNA polymerase-binding transcription factor DksA